MNTTITLGKKKIESDRVLNKIEQSIEEYRLMGDFFRDHGRISLRLVMNPDRLSRLESETIRTELGDMGIAVSRVLINRCEGTGALTETAGVFSLPTVSLPVACEPLLGVSRLARFIRDHDAAFNWMEDPGGPSA